VHGGDGLALLSLSELAHRIRHRKVSPVELTQTYLDRIALLDGQLHSFNCVMAERALHEARQAEDDIIAGRWRCALHGIPIAAKDIIDVEGVPTTAQSAVRQHHVAASDAAVVSQLRRAGAIILGKTATAEYAIGGTQFDLPWPAARNPWNLEKDPANSSCGSAIAVAAGLCAGALGSDTGGSIRAPAAWCGVAGLKPTHGLLSTAGVVPYSNTLDHVGPMAWTVADCAAILHAMVPTSVAPWQHGAVPSIAGVTIGVARHYYEDDDLVDDCVRAAMECSLAALVAMGARLVDIVLPPYETFTATATLISRPEGYAAHRQELTSSPELFGAATLSRLMAGRDIRAYEYINAQRSRVLLRAELDMVLERVDVIALPTSKRPAQQLGFNTLAGVELFFSRAFNLTGHPALAVCNGFSADGLPLSLQIVGRHHQDDLVMRVGHALECSLDLRGRRPAIAA